MANNNNTLTGIELVKELNSKITKGKWYLHKPDYEHINIVTDKNFICEIPTTIETNEDTEEMASEAEANAQYTALAVNNFAAVVEALEQLLDECNKRDIKRSYNTPAEITAIQVLNNIK